MAFTFFFRDQKPLELGIQKMLPEASGRSKVRIWDAGCAMGQEPYTLAILLAESMGRFAFRNLQVFASDYDKPLLDVLREGVYTAEELQRIPRELFEKYFQEDERKGFFRVVDAIRNVVSAQYHDLLSFSPIRNGFSMVVCKNVLLHFQQAERVEVIRMFHGALEPGGIFVTEHTQKLPQELGELFERVVPDAQVFRKIEAAQ